MKREKTLRLFTIFFGLVCGINIFNAIFLNGIYFIPLIAALVVTVILANKWYKVYAYEKKVEKK